MKKTEERKFRLDTAQVANLRLVSSRPERSARRLPEFENAREVILKLIEAVKRL